MHAQVITQISHLLPVRSPFNLNTKKGDNVNFFHRNMFSSGTYWL